MAEPVKFSPFEGVEISEAERGPDGCLCEDPAFELEIDCGSVYLRCGTCRKDPYPHWSDWIELVCMSPLPVTIDVEKPGPCNCHYVQYGCDCEAYITATPKVVES